MKRTLTVIAAAAVIVAPRLVDAQGGQPIRPPIVSPPAHYAKGTAAEAWCDGYRAGLAWVQEHSGELWFATLQHQRPSRCEAK